jgi:hypothetical protein
VLLESLSTLALHFFVNDSAFLFVLLHGNRVHFCFLLPSQIENVENQWKVRGAWDIRLDIRGIDMEEAIPMGFHVASTVIPYSPFDWVPFGMCISRKIVVEKQLST